MADDAEASVEYEFLEGCGDLTVVRRVFVPGEDSSYELAEVNETVEGLRRDRAAGLFRSKDDEATYQTQMAGLLARRTDLESRPTRAAGYEYIPTGKTYREQWAEETAEGRRQLLISAGVRYVLHGPHTGELIVPPDMHDHMRRSSSHQPASDGLSAVGGQDVPGYTPRPPTETIGAFTADPSTKAAFDTLVDRISDAFAQDEAQRRQRRQFQPGSAEEP